MARVANEAWIAAVATACGAGGVKLLEKVFDKKAKQLDDAAAIRQELRGVEKELRAELKLTNEEVDAWRDKYWDLFGQHEKAMVQCALDKAQVQRLEVEVTSLRETCDRRGNELSTARAELDQARRDLQRAVSTIKELEIQLGRRGLTDA